MITQHAITNKCLLTNNLCTVIHYSCLFSPCFVTAGVVDKEMSQKNGLKKKMSVAKDCGQKGRKDRNGWVTDETRHILSLVTHCVTQKIWCISDSKILNFVPLFSACLPTKDQYRVCGWKQMYFCYACHSETIPTVEEGIHSVWVLFGGKWLADWGVGGHRIQQWWSVTHKPLNQSHIWYPG